MAASPVSYLNQTPLAPLPAPSYFPRTPHAQGYTSPDLQGGAFAGAAYPTGSPASVPMGPLNSAQSTASYTSGYSSPYVHRTFSPPGQMGFPAAPPAGSPEFGAQRFGAPFLAPQGQGQQRPPVVRHQTMPSFGHAHQSGYTKPPYQQEHQSLRPPLAPLRSNTNATSAPSSIRSATSPTGSAFSGLAVETKKKRVYKVNLPREAYASEGEESEDGEGKARSTIARFPLSPDEKRALGDATVSEWVLAPEDEQSREVHFDEVHISGLPDMIDVFLPGKEGWDDLRDKIEAERPPSPKMTPSFKFPNFLALRPAFPPRAGHSEPSLPLHARAGSLSALPATLLRAVESRQRGHAASQSLALGPVGSPLSRAFSMPSWQAVQTTLAKGVASGLSSVSRLAEEVPLPLSPAVKGRFGGFLPGGVEWRRSTAPRPVLRPPPSPFASESGTDEGGGSGATSPNPGCKWDAAERGGGGRKPTLMELSLGFGMIEEDDEEQYEGDGQVAEVGMAVTRRSSVATMSTDRATAYDSGPDPGPPRPSSEPGVLALASIGETAEELSRRHTRHKSMAAAVMGRAQSDVVRSLSVHHFPPLPPSPLSAASATFRPEPGLIGNEDRDADEESGAESELEGGEKGMTRSPEEMAPAEEGDSEGDNTLTLINPDVSLPLISPGTAPSTASEGSMRGQQMATLRKDSLSILTQAEVDPEPVSPTPHPFEFDPPSPPGRASSLPPPRVQVNGGANFADKGVGTEAAPALVPKVMVEIGVQTDPVIVVGWGVHEVPAKVAVVKGEDGWWRRE